MSTKLWGIWAALDRQMVEELQRKDTQLEKQALEEIAETRAYELLDNGLASYAGEY